MFIPLEELLEMKADCFIWVLYFKFNVDFFVNMIVILY
jgi:hypothetical protein